jgi:hypothetical protein
MVPGLSFADAEQTGYEGVTHRRQILFARPGRGCAGYFLIVDRVTGEGEHTVDAHFHLPPGPARKSANGIRTDFPKGGNLLLQGLGEGELSLETSWIMTGYGEKTDRPDVRFRQHGRLPAVFVTLLVPYRSSATPGVQARLLAPAQATGPIAVEVSNGGRRDVLFAAPDVQPMSLPSFSGQGRAGLVRLDGAGKTILQAVVGEH